MGFTLSLPFIALALAMLGYRWRVVSSGFAVLALVLALWQGVLEPFGLIWLLLAAFSLLLALRTEGRWRWGGLGALAVLALLLASHHLPGFHNPLVLDAVYIGEAGKPFSLWANFDKGLAGWLLLVVGLARQQPADDGEAEYVPPPWFCALALLGVILLVLLAGAASGWVRWDAKWSEGAWRFLACNLFLTAVPEQVFFQGGVLPLLQRRLPGWLAIPACGLLFGLAHLPGGIGFALLAALAGCGYSLMFVWTRRLEWAVLTQFLLNASHFLLFTYPQA